MSPRKPSEIELANKRIAELEKENLVQQELMNAANNTQLRLQGELEAARAQLKSARASISALKGELSTSKAEVARLCGYMQRVHEDDVVRELGAAVEEPTQPRRTRREPAYFVEHRQADHYGGRYGSNEKPTDWWDR